MDDRIKILTTKAGTEYRIKTKLTRGERRKIEAVAYKNIDINDVPTDGSDPKDVKINVAGLLEGQEDVMISTVVASINNCIQIDVLKTYNNLFDDDAKEILEEVKKITDQHEVEKKSSSENMKK